jgi:tetratricopeptide (TPR) repeat protein
MNKKRIAIWSLVFAGVAAAMVPLVRLGCAVICIFIWGISSQRNISRKEAMLQKPSVFEPTAETLALYCQSSPEFFPDDLSYAWMPPEMADVGGYPWVTVSTNGASVEMGGGFYHFGYELNVDTERSNVQTNVWVLCFYSEGSGQKRLTEVALPKTRQLTQQELVARVLAGFDHRLKGFPTDNEAFKGNVQFLLRFGDMGRAKTTCMRWAEASPDYWMPHSALAHIRSRMDEAEVAQADYTAWVAAHTNFSNYICLFLFNMREGRDAEALAAIKQALSQPFVETPNSDASKFYLGHNGAIFAFSQGEYDLALAMCEKMLADSRDEESWLRRIWETCAAIRFMKGDKAGALKLMKKAAESGKKEYVVSSEGSKRDNGLFNAIKAGDVGFVKNYNNWKGEHFSWFSPSFNSIRAGFVGQGKGWTPFFTLASAKLDSHKPDSVDNSSARALRWLKQQQHNDGHWGEKQNQIELTSLATLAFLLQRESPGVSSEYGETVKNALEALMRDVESGAQRTGETDALLTYCLSEAFGITLHPMLLKSLDVQTNRLDFTQTTHWHVHAAKSLSFIDAYQPVGKQGLRTMCRSFPSNTTNMFNQASRLLLGMYSGDAMLREFSLQTIRNMDYTQWKTQENPVSLALLLSHVLWYSGGKDWERLQEFILDVIKRQNINIREKVGWWTPEGLGITTSGIQQYSDHERAVYVTSMVVLMIPPPGRNLPSVSDPAIEVKEELKSFKPDPDDIVIRNPEL